MMSKSNRLNAYQAIQDFRSARHKAILREVISLFTGESTALLPFDEVRQKLRAQIGTKKVLKEIPIAAIIGSVNRYQDFTRDFLPGRNIIEQRWANVEAATQSLEGLPPIEAYQLGEVYFVSDGNHRVSVARQLGDEEIQGYVTEVRTRVPLNADIRPEELIIKYEYAEFLENTNLDKTRPQADLSVTEPGQYGILLEHIGVHRYYMGIEQQHDIPPFEAAADWYDIVYLPVITIIRERGLLDDFPNRTEADLYLWIAEYRAALEESLKSEVPITSAADDLANQYSQRTGKVISRLGHKIVRAIVPDVLEPSPMSGGLPDADLPAESEVRLFREILVPVNGQQDGWFAVQQALAIAQREKSGLHGLFVVDDIEGAEAPFTQSVRDEFGKQCNSAGVMFDFFTKTGDVTQNICSSALSNDLVVLNLTYPPEPAALARLSSGIRNLIRRCPRPILFTPQVVTPLEHALLAYDGSLQAQEALYISTYLVKQWEISLHVLLMGEGKNIPGFGADVTQYLEHHSVHAEYTASTANHGQAIQQSVADYSIDLLLIGGYSRNPVIELIQGGEVDEILRQSHIPMLVCR